MPADPQLPAPAPKPAPVAPRQPPVPPPLLSRIALLCLRPEQWPQAARYRLSATLWPVIIVSVFMSLLVAITAASGTASAYSAFAAGYDDHFYPVELKENKLSRVTPATQPTAATVTNPAPPATSVAAATALVAPRFIIPRLTYVPSQSQAMEVILDPDNTEHPDIVESRSTLHITDSESIFTQTFFDTFRGEAQTVESRAPLTVLPPPTFGVPLSPDFHVEFSTKGLQDDTGLKAFLVLAVFGTAFMGQMICNLLWALLMGFLLIPVILMSAGRLGMPRSVAYRIGLAVTVPLIAVGGFLQATNVMNHTQIPLEMMPFLWVLAAILMALWSGIMANRMYSPRRAPRRGT